MIIQGSRPPQSLSGFPEGIYSQILVNSVSGVIVDIINNSDR
jgi:hypothetical protein